MLYFSRSKYYVLFVIGIGLVFVIQTLNGTPWMFKSIYGNDMLLFYIGGLAGTVPVFVISNALSNFQFKSIQTLSNGLILILGFQLLILKFYFALPDTYKSPITDYSAAFVILVVFIPIINFVKKYFPVILGNRVHK